jgi:BASS family bile acid:Na+ symporter
VAVTPAILLKLSIVVFMAGNLLGMGLRLEVAEALKGLRNLRFVSHTVLWGFILCPALAYLLTLIIPLAEPYAMGLILLGMAPSASFLPKMVDRAHGDLATTATFMLVASVFLIVYMPIMVPLIFKGLTVGPWIIAKPLVLFILVPMLFGMAILRASPSVAEKIQPVVNVTTGVAAIIMIVLCLIIYGEGFLGSAGSFALASLIVFFAVAISASYRFSFGLPRGEKIVLSLGLATRNLGASLAPPFAIEGIDQRVIVMVALALPVQMAASFLAAKYFARHGETSS